MIDITGLRDDKRPQSSTIVHALLDRLEAAEKERDELRNEIACVKEVEFPRKAQAVADAWKGKCERLEAERDALRAKIEQMERQEPVAVVEDDHNADGLSSRINEYLPAGTALYALPGAQAQPAPVEQDESVRKSWARFSNELHRSPDAPYPGMSEAFEQHFSQSFTDRDWRAESGTWAAAWKAAKHHDAQNVPSVPEGIIRDAVRYRFLRAAKNIPISTEAARDPVVYDAAIDAAMLAAAPEAKP